MRRVLVAAAAALVLSGCTSGPTTPDDDPTPSGSPTSAGSEPRADPGPRPKVGECHALTFRQAVAVVGRTAPVACRKPHTAQTYFVGRLDLTTKSGFTRRVDSGAAQRQMSRACTRRLPAHLGRTPRELRLRMVRAVWFSPSQARADVGADWFRCDVVAVAAPRRLLRLPRRTTGWAGPAMCATAPPGTPRFERVACSARHSWRAVATVDIPGKRLPRRPAITDRMEPVCRNAAAGRTDDPLDLTWSQESPTRAQWAAGQRYGICWVPA
ncbi:septum formation family protein [Nocardioides sp. zg-1228]|uniref:septum formation family protein n=1 Tax=Nocardioides sp. zg-1228 TaxID=2763008 RepID=UPI001642B2A8|nr:septum formation family protein [Nocardioides sp. zg-1228]MBC2934191.1 septum formation family protein [Nocardioides sp. zg-1228]QSF58936.1 septum formation family protein [Nocardioides sp. zg-1228]